MKKMLKYYAKNLIPAILILLLAGVSIESTLTNYTHTKNEESNIQLINVEFAKFANLLQQPLSDIYYLTSRKKSSYDDYISFLKNDFFVFSQTREYYQIRVLDTLGRETLRVNYNNNKHQIVADSLLQDKSHRYYFKEIQHLKKGHIYLSKLDLNQEYGELVHPFELVIRIASPIYDNSLKVGYLLINIKMDSFIRELVLGQNSQQNLVVFNQDSVNLSHLICPECKHFETVASIVFDEDLKHQTTHRAFDFSGIIDKFNSTHQTNLRLINHGWISIAADNSLASQTLLIYRMVIYGILLTLLIIFYSFLLTIRVQNMDHKLHRTMKEVLHNEKLLSIKNTQLESFIRIASHDLREPLATIKSTTYSLLEYENKTTDKLFPKYIDFIIKCVDRMDGLTKGVLDYAMTGESSRLSEIDTNQMVRDIRHDLYYNITEKKGKVIHSALPIVKGYPLELKQIFQNLISNSIKYCREDLDPVVYVTHEESIAEHIFQVIDNGIGINEKDRKTIFEMFVRLDQKANEEGLGIGLSITQKLVSLHGGSISLESNEAGGSTFSFTISKDLRMLDLT